MAVRVWLRYQSLLVRERQGGTEIEGGERARESTEGEREIEGDRRGRARESKCKNVKF